MRWGSLHESSGSPDTHGFILKQLIQEKWHGRLVHCPMLASSWFYLDRAGPDADRRAANATTYSKPDSNCCDWIADANASKSLESGRSCSTGGQWERTVS